MKIPLLPALACAALSLSIPAAAGPCYGGECPDKAHKPGQVKWYDALLSNAGWGEGPPCSSCHATSLTVELRERAPVTRNFPLKMDQRSYLAFHAEAVRLTARKGPLTTLRPEQVSSEHRLAYEWIRDAKANP